MTDLPIRATNPLLLPLGPIPDAETLYEELKLYPEKFDRLVAPYLQPYEMDRVLELVVPNADMVRGTRMIDRMMRHSLSKRDPAKASTERSLYALHGQGGAETGIQGGAGLITGMSGVGKTMMCRRALARYPIYYDHESLPGREGSVRQLVWLHVVVPGATTLWRFAEALLNATAAALSDENLAAMCKKGLKTTQGSRLFESWCQVVKSHYLGILVIDEAQNFFRMKAIKAREGSDRYQVADERVLRELLTFLESSGIPTLFLGTPDAQVALKARLAITSRLGVGGCLHFDRFMSPDDAGFENFMKRLIKYQFGSTPLTNTTALRNELYHHTAGIKREIISLWRHAQAWAAESEEALELKHFGEASGMYLNYMHDLAPGIIANDPGALQAYEDLRALTQRT